MNRTKTIELEKALLVGVVQSGMTAEVVEEHLEELAFLAKTAGAEIVGTVTQRMEKINPRYYIGSGKAEQIVNQAEELDVQLIIFDDELSPSQVRNFHKLTQSVKVMDRTGLILDVFAQHAQSREAKTQVELAQLQYLLPRLTRMWTHLERQMGGIGTRAGAGETQIEVDRRLVRERISRLKNELGKIDRERITQSKRRKEAFRVALVGYTNTGKSTLMNALTGSDIFVKDQLFATLDTTVRSLHLDTNHKILLSDSVGFIRKLPHNLIASFRSTLMEVRDADLLLIVMDASSLTIDEQLKTVREVLLSIHANQNESLLVMNKIDKIEKSSILQNLKTDYQDAIFISALNHLRLDTLQNAIIKVMDKAYQTTTVIFDPKMGKEISSVYQELEVLDIEYREDGVHLTVRGDPVSVKRVKKLSESGIY
ncbi:MAG: GTPase HflX [Candidatus Marinimicrobia bacterium]|nr:GTPase HflX [Candidatus Neomarinimicrobiota bacterium]